MATREEWARRVERWAGSGLGANEFATREGVSSKQLSKWKWFLKLPARLPGPRRLQPRRLGQGLPAFAPVRLVRRPTQPDETGGGEARLIEIVTRGGQTIRLRGSVDPAWVTSVIRGLDAGDLSC